MSRLRRGPGAALGIVGSEIKDKARREPVLQITGVLVGDAGVGRWDCEKNCASEGQRQARTGRGCTALVAAIKSYERALGERAGVLGAPLTTVDSSSGTRANEAICRSARRY